MTPASYRTGLWPLLLIPAVTALSFALYTGQIWEDFLITVRFTENFVNGNGLVYQVGERVHGFTSVLNVLVPAIPLYIFGSLDATIWIYRLCSLAALLAGLLILWNGQKERLGSTRLEFAFVAVLVATSVKIITFTMNGQESGFLVGFLCVALAATLRITDPTGWRWMGAAWAGLLYSRPDSPFYMVLLGGIALFVNPANRKAVLKALAKSAAVAAVCFTPWALFAWVYYGSPIPHTVIAKAGDTLLVGGSTLTTYAAIWARIPEMLGDIFGPIYGIGGWPAWVGWGTTLLAWATAFLWIVPIPDRFARGCSLALFITILYMAWLGIQRAAYPWYFAPASLLGAVIAGRIAAMSWKQREAGWRIAGFAAALCAVGVTAMVFLNSNVQIRIQQVEIEENTRKQIGLWLRDYVKPDETVFLEPMGYIGYYSKAHILDYPGLVAPSVVKARHDRHAGFAELTEILKPTWVVVRPGELERLKAVVDPLKVYELAKQFDARPALQKYGRFYGENYPRFDAVFYVLHRKPGM